MEIEPRDKFKIDKSVDEVEEKSKFQVPIEICLIMMIVIVLWANALVKF